MNARWFVLVPPLVALLAMSGLGPTTKPRVEASAAVGRPAPAFTLAQLHEPSRRLGTADMKGQVWLLNVWASWCAPCRDEHPLLLALARDEQLPIVGLSHRDDVRDAQEWLLRAGDPYTVSLVDLDGRVGVAFGVRGVPATYVIDRAGVVRLEHVGPLTPDIWMRKLRPLLGQLRG